MYNTNQTRNKIKANSIWINKNIPLAKFNLKWGTVDIEKWPSALGKIGKILALDINLWTSISSLADCKVWINDLWFMIHESNFKFYKQIFFKKLKKQGL